MPISFVRSETVASMMFMMPMRRPAAKCRRSSPEPGSRSASGVRPGATIPAAPGFRSPPCSVPLLQQFADHGGRRSDQALLVQRERDLAQLCLLVISASGPQDHLHFAEPVAGGTERDIDVVVQIQRVDRSGHGAAAVLWLQDADDDVGAVTQQQRPVERILVRVQTLGGTRARTATWPWWPRRSASGTALAGLPDV